MNQFFVRSSNAFQLTMAWVALLPRQLLYGVGAVLVGLWLILILAPAKAEKLEVYKFETMAAPVATNPTAAPASIVNTSSGVTVGSSHPVQASPSITPARIESVLRQYNSPAVGVGQAMYDLGIKYGIDPAFALAFFIHESGAGTQGVATITKSIGNIRCTPGYDCYQTSGNGSFRRYSSWEAGIEDWYKLIKDLYIGQWKLTTLEQIIPVYAPSADRNSPAAYIKGVAQMVEGWRG